MRGATLIDWSQSLDSRGSFRKILKHEEMLITPDFEASARAAAFVVPMATVISDQPPNPGKGFLALAEIPTPEGVIRLTSPKTLKSLLEYYSHRFEPVWCWNCSSNS